MRTTTWAVVKLLKYMQPYGHSPMMYIEGVPMNVGAKEVQDVVELTTAYDFSSEAYVTPRIQWRDEILKNYTAGFTSAEIREWEELEDEAGKKKNIMLRIPRRDYKKILRLCGTLGVSFQKFTETALLERYHKFEGPQN